MGFFSKITKIWKKTEDTPESAAPEQAGAEQIDAAVELPLPEPQELEEPAAVVLEADAQESAPEPGEATPAAVAAEPAPEPVFEPAGEADVAAAPESAEEPAEEPSEGAASEPAPAAVPEPAPESPAPAPEPAESAPAEPAPAEPAPAPEPPVEEERGVAPKPAKSKFSLFKSRKPKQAKPEPAPEPVAPAAAPEPVEFAPAGSAPAPEPPQSEAPLAAAEAGWQQELTLALRAAEPRLSVWLEHVLGGVEEAGPELWERLEFLFKALEAPADETQDFIKRFAAWLEDMDYERVEEFRSELQYRLALALELEDEEDERNRLFLKLSEGLSKTRETITKQIDGLLSAHSTIDQAFWEDLEEILIMADVGFEAATELTEKLRTRARQQGVEDPAQFKDLLREELEEIFKEEKRIKAYNPPEVVLVIGVNGVGKTTTIAKLAHREQMQGRKVLIAAGDTFRAAAVEQLSIWAKRVGAGFYAKGQDADPAAVAYEAMDKCLAEGYDLLLMDTAGRLHTKVNLMEELHKIKKVLGKKHPGAPNRSILVVDATTGQNALSQTKLFSEAVGVDEIILTKLDGTAKGGVVVAVAMRFGLPITFVGLGEKMEDLRPFNGKDFATALLAS